MRVVLSSGVLVSALIFTTSARAEPGSMTRETARLEYERGPATETCPDEDELRRSVAARLGYEPFATSARRRVVVKVMRRPRALVGLVELYDDRGRVTGTRELTSPSRDCRELVDSLSVAIAIGIDPVHGLSGSRELTAAPTVEPPLPELPPSDPPPVAAPPVVRESPTDARQATPPEPLRFRGSAGALVAIGAAPAPAVGLAVGLGGRIGRGSLDIEGRADLPSSTSVDSGGRLSASLLLASAVPCLHFGIVAGCALGTVGAFRAEGESITDPLRTTKAWGGAGGRLGVEVPLGRVFALRLHADLLATITRLTLRMNMQDVWTSPPISVGLGTALVGIL